MAALRGTGSKVFALSRQDLTNDNVDHNADVKWQRVDLQSHPDFPEADVLFHCAPIWLLPDNLQKLHSMGIERVVAFSSTSAQTKFSSRSKKERNLARRLRESELTVIDKCEKLQIGATIFRPTMIYGYGRDKNISVIASFIRRYKIFFIAGQGSGLRQPVHVDDLVAGSLNALAQKDAIGKQYDLAGGETLSYKDMVARIFAGVGMPPRIVRLPVVLYRVLLSGIGLVRRRSSYTGGMATRMNEDLVFDYSAAVRDIGYQPRAFLTNPSKDLIGATS